MKLLQCCCSAESMGLSFSHRRSLAFCRGFCSTICLQLLAIVYCQDCIPASALFIFKALIYTTEFLEAPLYCPITCKPISPCSVDIGNSLEGIVTEFELMQHKRKSCFFVFIIKSIYYLKIFLPENKFKKIFLEHINYYVYQN